MTTIYEVDAQKYHKKLAEELKNIPEIKAPEWINFVKSGVSKERPPQEEDFWHKRAASVLRQIYVRGVVGVSRLRTKYGGKKERGSRPAEFRKGGGKNIRLVLQQLEKAGILEKSLGKKKGRQLTRKGLDFMNKIAEGMK
ncbi:30S ribosomal protein S19e [Candidatus Pacearchaeota archaeon]|nr:30S ribosomal protein S19e [Candidatus Pacearchaeota archaeon]